jgi:hypothetical protein
MPAREGPSPPAPPGNDSADNDPADKVRGGEMILRTRVQRAIVIVALVAAVLLALLLQVAH